MDLDVYTIEYTKAEMGQIPEQERLLHFAAGQLLNEIGLFNRLTLASLNYSTAAGPKGHANIVAALTFVKLVSARLYEAGLLLREPKFAAVLEAYTPDMSPPAAQALRDLMTYFAGKNLLADVRNKVAAHVDIKTLKSGYTALPPDEVLTDYLAMELGNTLHFSAFAVGAFSLQRVTKEAEIAAAVSAVVDEAIEIASKFNTLFNGYMVVFFSRHFPQKLDALASQTPLKVSGVLQLEDLEVPMFVSPIRRA